MKRMHFATTAAVVALFVLSALPPIAAGAADTPVSVNPMAGPNPTSVTTVGTLRVERYGSGTPAMIFIPGLSSGSWVWDGAVTRYASKHAVYVVTLAGFDGIPIPPTPTLDAADASLLELIQNEKLARPIVVGHSLGGYLALRFGTEHANLVRAIVSVDGLPVFPTLAQSTPEQRATMAKAVGAQIAAASPAEYASSQLQTISTMVSDPTNAARVARLSGASDPKAVAAYAVDLFSSDLRPQLANLTVPTLVLAPIPPAPASFESPGATMTQREASYRGFYQSLFPGAPQLTVVTIPNSKHFIMVDQPEALYDAITAFIAKVP